MIDRSALAHFLKTRRHALQPEDVGLLRGPRRRTSGLRREEVADLAGMSADYFARLERGSGPDPSEQMIGAIARALRLSLAERDYVFRLAGHRVPHREHRSDHLSPGLMRVLDRLEDTPAQVMNALGETLVQTNPARALLGDQTSFAGLERSNLYRWFTRPESRSAYAQEDHANLSRTYIAQFRQAVTSRGAGPRADRILTHLLEHSPEFAGLWAAHEIGLEHTELKRFVHPQVGDLELHCQVLVDPDQAQTLLVFTATPGTPSYEKLQLLCIIGHQQISPSRE